MEFDKLCTSRKLSDVHLTIGALLGQKPPKHLLVAEVKENVRRTSCPFL
jgi:hypothetical protein